MRKSKSIKGLMVSAVLGIFLITSMGCSNNSTKSVESSKDIENKTTDTSTNNTEEDDTSISKGEVYERPNEITSSDEAKELLTEGNKRFVEGNVLNDDLSFSKRRELVENGQKPFAVIVCCSDSRVPPEIIFDQALGDIFIIRNAGNVMEPVSLGSIEYGVEHLHAPLIIVLGHENCGAVKATLDGGEVHGNLKSIIDKITPSVEATKKTNKDKDKLYDECIDENMDNTINEIRKSPIITEYEEEGKIIIIGAKYHTETGEVTFEE